MRLFIALPVPATLRRNIGEVQTALKNKGVRARFVPQENLHLTLCFLGSVKDPEPAEEAIRSVSLPKTALRFERLTLFGDVTAALFQPDAALESYVRNLRHALDEAGLAYDKQTFRPHVTLARKTALPCPGCKLSPFEKPLRGARLPVKEVQLTASDLSGGTPKYTVIFKQ